MPAIIEITYGELAQAALGAEDLNNFNIELLHSLISLLLDKLGCRNEKIQLAVSVGRPVKEILQTAGTAALPITPIAKVAPVEQQLQQLATQVEDLRKLVDTYSSKAGFSTPAPAKTERNSKKFNLRKWEMYGDACEDLFTTCEPENDIACKLIQNEAFMKKMARFISTPIVERSAQVESKFDDLMQHVENVLKKARADQINQQLVINVFQELRELRDKVHASDSLFLSTMDEVQDMLDAKLDKVHMPSLKKYIKENFEDVRGEIEKLEKQKDCPKAAGVIVERISCLSCGRKNVFVDDEPQVLPLNSDKMTEKPKIQPKASTFRKDCFCYTATPPKQIKLMEKIEQMQKAEKGLDHIAENILSYLDANSLKPAELVCKEWLRVISEGMLWKKLIERKVRTDSQWRGLAERRNWIQYLFKPRPGTTHRPHSFYRELYPKIMNDIESIENNWRTGRHMLRRINCRSENSKGVYCLQYDDVKIVSGLRDNTIKIWDRTSLQCVKTLTGHTGSVLCLQYDDKVIISGSSDSTVRVWDVNTGEMVNTLIHHCEAVLHLRFNNGMMVTCSKDRSIAVWDMTSPGEIQLRRVLVGHRAAVNVVDFDEKYIVSASGDRSIKVWSTSSCEFVRTLNGHKRGIACLQYRDHLVVSGSSDNSIRLWDIECGACLRVLEGHEELVRCIRFDSKRIVSGAYDGKIKVWDLVAALDPRAQSNSLCLNTLVEHTGRVFRLQFDEFQIVSSSHDDTILIWDFLNFSPNEKTTCRTPSPALMEH